MTYGQLRDRVLQLIFSYSVAGDRIPPSYNNQADYIKQIPGLLNSAQTYIYQIKHFEDSVRLTDLDKDEINDKTDMYMLPDDCVSIKAGLIIPGADFGTMDRFWQYKIMGGNKLLVPHGVAERLSLILEYNKRGSPCPDNPPDDWVLKNTDEVNEMIPFYIAAFCVIYDDSFRYAALKNEFEDRLNRLAPNPTYIEMSEIRDFYPHVYDTAYWGETT